MIQIGEPAATKPERTFALLNLGFRPFYLLAALFGALSVAGWVAVFLGGASLPHIPGVLWHQHEMVFGFALAVITGFLLTAGRVWTGLPTPDGAPLAALALHWVAARVLMFTGPAPAAALVDGAFPFVVAAVMARVIVGSRNVRNYFVIVLLGALGAANIAFHLGHGAIAVRAALWLVMTLVVVMAGRVVPAFTANALPRAGVVRRPRVDYVSVAVTVLAFGFDLLGFELPAAALALAATALHAFRQWGWKPLATRGRPILWILHLSHAWIPVGFALLALAALGIVPGNVPLHAFGAGAMGGLIIGMITRTALGHTGRPLATGRAENAAYVLVHLAAALRVLAGLAPASAAYLPLVVASGGFWAAAFLLYFATYLPRLAQARLDGRPG
jgi:uncharacterized protein involved in response to NO